MRETVRKAAAGLCVLVCAALAVSLPLAGCTVRKTEQFLVTYDRGNIAEDTKVENWPSDEKVARKGFVAEPTAPTAEGYTFNAWYTTEEATVRYDFSACIEHDITIYANWTQDYEAGQEPEPEPGPETVPAPAPGPLPGEVTDGMHEGTPGGNNGNYIPEAGQETPSEGSHPGSASGSNGTEGGQDETVPGPGTDEGAAEEPGTEPVEPAEADIILFAGQSNMAGRGEYTKYDAVTTSVAAGHGYAYDIHTQSLGALQEPFGATQNGSGHGYMSETSKSGSMVSAFVESYYAETGRPVVAVSASQGGSPVKAWTKGGAYCTVSSVAGTYCNYYRDTLERLTGAVKCVEQDDSLELHAVYMVWLQGETDGALATPAEEYISALDSVYTSLTADLQSVTGTSLDHLYVIPIGTYEGGSTETAANYDVIRAAQLQLCASKDYADCISLGMQDLTASGTEHFLKADSNHVHLTQPGYELIGRDAGSNMGRLTMGGTPVLQRYDVSTASWFVPMEDIAPIPGDEETVLPPAEDETEQEGQEPPAVDGGSTPPEDNADDTEELPPAEGGNDMLPDGGNDASAPEGGELPDGSVSDETEDDPDQPLPPEDDITDSNEPQGPETDEGGQEPSDEPGSGEEDTTPGTEEDVTPGEGTEEVPGDAEGPADEENPSDEGPAEEPGTESQPEGGIEEQPEGGIEEQPEEGVQPEAPAEGEDVPAAEPSEGTEEPGEEEQNHNAVMVLVDTADDMISLDTWDNEVQTLGAVLVLPDNYDLNTDRALLGWYYTTDDGHSYTKVTSTTKVQRDMTIVPYFANEFYNLSVNDRDTSASHVQDAGPSWGSSPMISYDNKFVLSREMNTSDYSEDLTVSWTGANAISDGVWFRLITHFSLSSGNIPTDYFNVFYELTNHGTEDITVTVFFCTSGYPGLASSTGDTDNILASAVATIPAGQTVLVVMPHMLYTSEHSYQNFPTAIMIGDYDSNGNRLSEDTHTYKDFEIGLELGMYYSNTLTFANMQTGSVSAEYLVASGSVVSFNTETSTLVVCKGNTIQLPEATLISAPEGYTFGGWYLDAECTKPAGTSLSVYEDTVIYAGWIPAEEE
ncbi:MAG: InlB B-repeat-containing protein [Clostridia bacterium]|nr:InlB B-repeat-containing protein [Clostridia bacterium]